MIAQGSKKSSTSYLTVVASSVWTVFIYSLLDVDHFLGD